MNARIFALVGLIIAIAAAGVVFVPPETTLSIVRTYSDFASVHAVLTMVVVGIVYVACFAFIIPILSTLAFALGFLYGFVPAFLAVSLATIVGALLPFLYARYRNNFSSRRLVGDQYERLFALAKEHPISYLLTTRFAPFVPFPLAHFIPAEARVRTIDFVWTTLIGALPASAAYIALGSSSRLLALGEPVRTFPIIAGLLGLSLLVFGALYIRHAKGVLTPK